MVPGKVITIYHEHCITALCRHITQFLNVELMLHTATTVLYGGNVCCRKN